MLPMMVMTRPMSRFITMAADDRPFTDDFAGFIEEQNVMMTMVVFKPSVMSTTAPAPRIRRGAGKNEAANHEEGREPCH